MLQKQIIDISLAQGLNQLTEEKISQEGSTILKNARFNKIGEVSKTKGLTILGSINDKEIIVDPSGAIHAFSPEGVKALRSDGWVSTSTFNGSPSVEVDYINMDAEDHVEPDMDRDGDFLLSAVVLKQGQVSSTLTPTYLSRILVVLECLKTGIKKSKILFGNGWINPKVFRINGENFVFYQEEGGDILFHTLDINLDDIDVERVATPSGLDGFDACYDSSLERFYLSMSVNEGGVYTDRVIALDMDGVILYDSTPTPHAMLQADLYSNRLTTAICATDAYVVVASRNLMSYLTIFDKNLNLALRVNQGANQRHLSIIGINSSKFALLSSNGSMNTYESLDTRVYDFDGTNLTYNFITMERLDLSSKAFLHNGDICVIANCVDDSNASFYVINVSKGLILGRFSPEQAVPTVNVENIGVDYFSSPSLSKVVNISDGIFSSAIVKKKTSDQADFRRALSSVSSARVKMDFNSKYSKSIVGESVTLTNGMTIEIDSERAYENGYLVNPVVISFEDEYDGTNNWLGGKTFSYCAVYEFYDSDGQLTRSPPSKVKPLTTPAQATLVKVAVALPVDPLKSIIGAPSYDDKYFTNVVIYRTTNNGSVFYRCAETRATGTLSHVLVYDGTPDTELETREILYTTGGVLQNDPAPVAKYSVSGGGRLFLAGLEVDEVAFSKKYLYGESITFSDLFRIGLATGGSFDKSKITGLGYMDGKLFIFKERSVYMVQGDGPNELGQNDSFTTPEIITGDVGCISHASIQVIPDGIIFQSDKGIWLLSRGLSFTYIGAGVDDLSQSKVISSVVNSKESEVRFYTENGVCLIYNYVTSQWSSSEQYCISVDTLDGDIITSDGQAIRREGGFLNSLSQPFSMTVKTPWFKTSSIQGFARIWTAKILGKFKSAHKLRVRVYYDYDSVNYDEYVRSPKAADKQYQYEIHLKRQKCEAIQFEVSDIEQSGTMESMALTGITLEAGVRKGSFKLPSTRRT